MKTTMMRAPLYKAAAVLLFLVILAYLTSASPEGGVFNAVGQIIIGAFRFVQWSIGMVIGLTFSIAVLIAIFLFAVSLVNKASAAAIYQTLKLRVIELCQPIFSQCRLACITAKATPCADALAQSSCCTLEQPKEELVVKMTDAIQKVIDDQKILSEHLAALGSKMQSLEAKSADFVATSQLENINAELVSSVKALGAVQENLSVFEGKVNQTLQQLNTNDQVNDQLAALGSKMQSLEAKSADFVATSQLENINAELVSSVKALGAVQENLSVFEGKVNQTLQQLNTNDQVNDQLAALGSKMQSLEAKSADFVATSQLENINAELVSSVKALGAVQENLSAFEGKVNQTLQQVNAITLENILGDIPERLQKLEASGDEPGFDPAPLAASIETLKQELEELKKKGMNIGGKARKKA